MGTISENIIYEIKKVICGKDYIIAQALTAILAGGHILMEDVPGVGKTTMAVAFSKTMGLNYGRVQFTPDVLPSDITGFSLYDKNTNTMKYQPGSIFHNLFLSNSSGCLAPSRLDDEDAVPDKENLKKAKADSYKIYLIEK